MLKILQVGFSNIWTVNFQMFNLVLEKAEEPEIKLPTFTGSSKKQESSRKHIYFCFIDYARDFRCRFMLFIWLFSCFLRYACIAMNHPLKRTFTVSHKVRVVLFSFSFVSMHILISVLTSSLIYWLFSRVFFSPPMLDFLIVFLL